MSVIVFRVHAVVNLCLSQCKFTHNCKYSAKSVLTPENMWLLFTHMPRMLERERDMGKQIQFKMPSKTSSANFKHIEKEAQLTLMFRTGFSTPRARRSDACVHSKNCPLKLYR